jgi:cytidylate kinase
MSPALTIAIDGPAASGKSTLAELLARRLGYLYFDTGVMYRAVTLAALRAGIGPGTEGKLGELAESVTVDVRPPSQEDGRAYDVLLNGEDVTWEIRSPQVERSVSEVSRVRRVRDAMTRRQREIGSRGEVVMVGRDIGTVVMPDADLKLYLDATPEVRAVRRHRQEDGRRSLEDTLRDIRHRDQIDSTRAVAPLKPAEDSLVLDTSDMTIEQVLEWAHRLAAEG